MSRSYHVTQKKAIRAILDADVGPAYLASEKHWVKKASKKARKSKQAESNRAIVSGEKQNTSARKQDSKSVYSLSYGFAQPRKSD